MLWLLALLLVTTAWAGETTMPGERSYFSGRGATLSGKCIAVNKPMCANASASVDALAQPGQYSGWLATVYGTGVYGYMEFIRGRGTVGSPTAAQSGDTLGAYEACGHDGTGFCGIFGLPDATMNLKADGTFTTSSHPTTIEFNTTPSGSTTPAKALAIRQDKTIEATKTVAVYNNIATVSNGMPSEVAKIDTTGLTGNVSSAALYAVPSTGAGLYRVSALVVETTAASVSSTLANVQVLYTDADVGSGTVTIDATPVLGVAGMCQAGALTANTVGTTATGVIVINVKASTNINYQTVNYASTAAGMAYAIHVKAEAL